MQPIRIAHSRDRVASNSPLGVSGEELLMLLLLLTMMLLVLLLLLVIFVLLLLCDTTWSGCWFCGVEIWGHKAVTTGSGVTVVTGLTDELIVVDEFISGALLLLLLRVLIILLLLLFTSCDVMRVGCSFTTTTGDPLLPPSAANRNNANSVIEKT